MDDPLTAPPPPGVTPPLAFGAAELSTTLASTSQTLSPDGKALSLLFTGFSAQAQGSGLRGAVAAGSLAVPLTGVTSAIFVKVALRGSVVIAGPDASARLEVQANGFGLGSGFTEEVTIEQDLDLQLGPDAPVVILNLLLSCQVFGAGATLSALITLDSVDLAIQ